jgi:23S rRNA pseudouridine1911/1915/1917 synthase
METKQWKVEQGGPRVDVWLSERIPELSRSRLQALIKSGQVLLGGRPVKAHHRVVAGDEVAVAVPDAVPTELAAEAIPLAIVFEDGDLIVVNKPPGLVVHPAAGHPDGTLVNALLHHCHDLAGIGGERRPGIVHRLDRDTSGLLVVAKNETALNGLTAQFKNRTVRKEYLAVVWGIPRPASGRTETLIGRSSRDRKKMSATPRAGRPAITRYETLEAFAGAALLRVTIETGRTHQIRVHMTHLGHPVVGDREYGRKSPDPLPAEAPRQMLHAARLAFQHPRTGALLAFEAPIPPDMQTLLDALRREDGRRIT